MAYALDTRKSIRAGIFSLSWDKSVANFTGQLGKLLRWAQFLSDHIAWDEISTTLVPHINQNEPK